jgi:hypothetical protein
MRARWVRQAAEDRLATRRMLQAAIAAQMQAPAMLTRADLGELANALDDAAAYREPETGHCPDCTKTEMCDDHAGDHQAAGSYRRLMARLSEMEAGE